MAVAASHCRKPRQGASGPPARVFLSPVVLQGAFPPQGDRRVNVARGQLRLYHSMNTEEWQVLPTRRCPEGTAGGEAMAVSGFT
jgi:hypothetical protein